MNRPWQTDTAFSEALIELIPEHTKKKTPQFIQKIVDGELNGSDDVHVELREWQKRDSQRAQKLKPIFQAINDYDGIIGILCSSDPYPSALIWGGLKAVVECFRRYYQVFEQLEGQLKSLTHHLKLLKQYEELFCESEHMKDLLVASYKGIIRFWIRVEDHCTTPGFVRALKTVTSISLTQINEIITDIADTSRVIERLVPVLQEQRRRSERDETVEERQNTQDKLDELLRRVSTKDQIETWSRVCEWIMGRDGCRVSEHINRPYEQRVQTRLAGTGDWLLEDPQYRRWSESGSEANILWLRGGAGVGKSTICSQIIDRLEAARPEATVAFHFFSFDEEQSPTQVYRNIARRLFFAVYSDERDEISDEVLGLLRSDPTSIGALQMMIVALVAEAKSCFVFLDGLDEELENSKKERWQNARALLSFFITLASAPDSGLKLWCSSQDHREIRQVLSAKAEKIQLSAAQNTGDIEKLLQSALKGRNYLDKVADSKKDEVLSDLRKQVNGSFLWAALMLDIIKDALSLADVEDMVSEGIPHDFETYLERMVRRFPPTQHKFISDSLSCLVYAKRPLFLDELCEAIEIHKVGPGDNIQPACLLMRDRLVDACGPLVRVDEGTETKGRQVCTLSHGAVKAFLVKHPQALSDRDDCRISPEILGTGCFKYLQQIRYKTLLKRGNRTFETSCGSDINGHALLNYAAKYWHRHLDDAPYTSDLCNTVYQFVQSSNFMTCLQVQSLFVGGHFSLWYNWGDELQLTSLVRAFPKWFVKKHHCGARIQEEYHAAIGEWSYYLSTQSTYAGKFRGEIERCLWGCLGESNFLHKVPSTIKSFILENVGVEAPARAVKFYDRVSPDGSEIDFFKLTVKGADSHLLVERWALKHGRSPKLKATQQIMLSEECLRLYQHGLKRGVAEKASMLDVTSDGKVLRVGSQFYSGNAGTSPVAETLYEPLQLPDGFPSYVQAVSCNSRYFAVAWRDQILEEDVKLQVDPAPATGRDRNDSSDTLLNCSSSTGSSGSSTGSSSVHDESTDGDGNSEDARSAMETSENQPAAWGSRERNAIPNSNADSLEVRSEFSDRHGYDALDWSEESSMASNSARESWSGGSTSAKSDEIGQDRILEDFDDDSSLSFKEDGLSESGLVESSSGDRDVQFENMLFQHSSLSLAKSLDSFVDRSSDDHSSSESERQAPSSVDDSAYDYGSSDQSDDDGEGTRATIARLENLLKIRREKQQGASCEVQVYRLSIENKLPQTKVFSFRQRSQTRLYASPPAFHPTSDLLVWPLGDNEILFANFTENAYFIRTGTKSQPQSCQVSVQCHFSDCGMYLHMASFEGFKMRYTDGEVRLGFKLLVTTHRLSLRKTARSPPHLIYRTSVNLLGDLAEGEQLDVMNLPFSLSWGKNHLFVTEKCLRLLAHRLPLFREVERKDITPFAPRGVVHNLGDVFLPVSSLVRNIRFFASEEWPKSGESAQSKTKSSRKGRSPEKSKPKYVAHVLLGSRNESAGRHRLENGPNELLCARTAPQGFHLTREHLGDWDGEQSHVLKQKSQTWRGGELMAKLEKFDMSEDCDIVPYLHY